MNVVQPSRVALITGGSRGIGAATARLAAARGYAVVVNFAANEAAAANVVAAIEADGGIARAVRGDVADPAAVEAMFQAADEIGTLAALVNNAGVVDLECRVEDMTAARIERILRINVTGSFLCAGAAVRRMSTRYGGAGGVIVNVSSGAAKLGSPATYVDYAASKGAIDTFTVGLAKEVVREGIRVAAVRPGITDTEIHADSGTPDRVAQVGASLPMGRAGTAAEVAAAILWLMSDEASYSTGTIIDVTGGRSILP